MGNKRNSKKAAEQLDTFSEEILEKKSKVPGDSEPLIQIGDYLKQAGTPRRLLPAYRAHGIQANGNVSATMKKWNKIFNRG